MVTFEQVLAWKPCYDLTDIEQLFNGRKFMTVDDLRTLNIPIKDKLWCLLHEEILPKKQLHLLACDFAEHALLQERAAGREPDARSWAAIETKRRWVRGDATDAELKKTWSAAMSAWSAWSTRSARSAWSAVAALKYAAAMSAWSAAAYAAADAKWQLEHTFDVIDNLSKGEK